MESETGETPGAEFTPVQQNWNCFGLSCASSPPHTLLEGMQGMEREPGCAITHTVISAWLDVRWHLSVEAALQQDRGYFLCRIYRFLPLIERLSRQVCSHRTQERWALTLLSLSSSKKACSEEQGLPGSQGSIPRWDTPGLMSGQCLPHSPPLQGTHSSPRQVPRLFGCSAHGYFFFPSLEIIRL